MDVSFAGLEEPQELREVARATPSRGRARPLRAFRPSEAELPTSLRDAERARRIKVYRRRVERTGRVW